MAVLAGIDVGLTNHFWTRGQLEPLELQALSELVKVVIHVPVVVATEIR